MKSKEILIITTKLDPHADIVITHLEKKGQSVLRINTEDLLSDYAVSLRCSAENGLSGEVTDMYERRVILVNGVKSAYYRKPKAVKPPKEISNDGISAFAISEGQEFLNTIYNFPGLRWVNHPFAIKSAQVKYSQLFVAKELGFKIPKSLITNNVTEARLFCQECGSQVISKSLITTSVQIEETSYHTYTHKLTEKDINEYLDNCKYLPTFFQEYIPKKSEIRATVIGDHIFACEIDSQQSEDTSIDWRTADPFTIPHRPINLPRSVSEALIKFIKHYGLSFGAIDIILTPENEYVFLENNPNGQWYWIELITGMRMAEAMAELLIGT